MLSYPLLSGLKLERGNNYSQSVNGFFHISQATLVHGKDSEFTSDLLAVHAVVNETDYILCYLGSGHASGYDSLHPVIQQSLNLEVADGEEITLYIDYTSKTFRKDDNVVHLTGYFSSSSDGLDDGSFLVTDEEDESVDREDEENFLDCIADESDGEISLNSSLSLPPVIEELSVRN